MEHVWKRVWQLACREEDIPAIGDHLTYDVADLSLIIVRSSSTDIKAFSNSCLHRGRRLVSEPGCKSSFRCPYHAWTWNLEGAPIFIPCKTDFESYHVIATHPQLLTFMGDANAQYDVLSR